MYRAVPSFWLYVAEDVGETDLREFSVQKKKLSDESLGCLLIKMRRLFIANAVREM